MGRGYCRTWRLVHMCRFTTTWYQKDQIVMMKLPQRHLQLGRRGRTAGQRISCVALWWRTVSVFTLAGCPLHLWQIGTLPLPALFLQLHPFLWVAVTPCLLLLHLLDSRTPTQIKYLCFTKSVPVSVCTRKLPWTLSLTRSCPRSLWDKHEKLIKKKP